MIIEPEEWQMKQEAYNLFAEIIETRNKHNATKQEQAIIFFPAEWPNAPVFNLGDFLKEKGTVEGIVRDGANWLYFVRGCGWIKEDDLLLQEEPEPVKMGKLDDPTKPYDDFDPFINSDDLP